MQSYSSPGRVITVQNFGPGAVEVRRDQPYRLRGLVGITQHSAKVGAALNLCVEGSYDQFVTLAAGIQLAEAGDAVLMHIGTFALVVGFAADGDHIPFGLLCERINGPSLTTVKLTPGSAATASGDGEPALAGRVGEVEQAVIGLGHNVEATSEAVSLFDGRLDQAEAAIGALQAGGSGGGGADYLQDACVMTSAATSYTPNGSTVGIVFNQTDRPQGRDCHFDETSGGMYFVSEASGWYSFDFRLTVGTGANEPSRIGMQAVIQSPFGSLFGFELPGGQVSDVLGYVGFEQRGASRIYTSGRFATFLPANHKVALQMYRLNTDSAVGGFHPGNILIDRMTVIMRREA